MFNNFRKYINDLPCVSGRGLVNNDTVMFGPLEAKIYNKNDILILNCYTQNTLNIFEKYILIMYE